MITILDSAGAVIFRDVDVAVKMFAPAGDIPLTNGSLVDARFTAYAGHTPFVARVDGNLPSPLDDCVVTVVGNTLSWTWPAGSAKPPMTIIYGIART